MNQMSNNEDYQAPIPDAVGESRPDAATAASFPPPDQPHSASPNRDVIMRIPVSVQVILGSTSLQVAELAKLVRGSVISLDRKVGEPVDVVVNGRIIARGEIIVMGEGETRFGIRLTEAAGLPGDVRVV